MSGPVSGDPATATIRTFSDDDFDAVDALWRACGLWRPWNDPAKDIAFCRGADAAELFVAEIDATVVGSVMCGHDGHRGWVYYLAVDPDLRRAGLGRRLMRRAERWLAERGAPKAQLMVRRGNAPVRAFYAALGYADSDVVVLETFLDEEAGALKRAAPRPTLEITVTYLEMRAPPTRTTPAIPKRAALMRAVEPTVSFYRYLYDTVGAPWLWYERRQLSDEELAVIVQDPKVEVYVLYSGGVPAGFAELDRRRADEIELAYFGLMPEFIGRRLGLYLLTWAVDQAWSYEPARLWVHSCSLDHPRALGLYQKAGFVAYEQEHRTIDNPVAAGLIPVPRSDESGLPAPASG